MGGSYLGAVVPGTCGSMWVWVRCARGPACIRHGFHFRSCTYVPFPLFMGCWVYFRSVTTTGVFLWYASLFFSSWTFISVEFWEDGGEIADCWDLQWFVSGAVSDARRSYRALAMFIMSGSFPKLWAARALLISCLSLYW